jgi:hypothetical protein
MKLFLQNRLSGENAINQSNRANTLITKHLHINAKSNQAD